MAYIFAKKSYSYTTVNIDDVGVDSYIRFSWMEFLNYARFYKRLKDTKGKGLTSFLFCKLSRIN